MAWVAADRCVKMSEESGQEGAVEGLRRMRDDIHEEVCRKGYDAERNTFTQYYGSTQLDAALLLIPQVGSCRRPTRAWRARWRPSNGSSCTTGS